MGALFKSQNGSLWTENQYQDMKFKLYKADFTVDSGTAVFYNPDIITPDDPTPDENSIEVPRLLDNPIITLPKKGRVGIDTFTSTSGATSIALPSIISPGRKINAFGKKDNTAVIESLGGRPSQVGVATGGKNYVNGAAEIDTYNIIGQGSGLKVKIDSVEADGAVSTLSIPIDGAGEGYKKGDIVGITTSQSNSKKGRGVEIRIGEIQGTDTLYLTNIQGANASWTNSIGQSLNYRDGSATSGTIGIATHTITSYTANGAPFDGSHFEVEDFEHGMYSTSNKITIKGIQPDTPLVNLSASISATDTQLEVGSAQISKFAFFEGVPVGAANTGYIKLGDEIIGYETVGAQTLESLTRGVDTSVAQPHGQINTVELQKYEISGVSLRRINGIERGINDPFDLDSYHLTFNRSSSSGSLRNIDNSASSGIGSVPQLSFNEQKFVGGDNVHASTNIMFGAVVPTFNLLNPGSNTTSSATIRSISGTSVGGSEESFVDQGFESVQINEYNALTTPRIVASKGNEDRYLTNLPRNKSLTVNLTLSKTASSSLSPILRTDTAFVELINHRLNNPIGIENYAIDGRVDNIANDPHAATYMSTLVELVKPATSLKVLFSAYRDETADIRVLYALNKPDDGGEIRFELFPGYKNLIDTTEDGNGNLVIDSTKNDGRSDVFVPASLDGEFLEYQFTAENLPEFTGYIIKIVMSGTNQARPPKIKDLRTIAVRW